MREQKRECNRKRDNQTGFYSEPARMDCGLPGDDILSFVEKKTVVIKTLWRTFFVLERELEAAIWKNPQNQSRP